MKYFYYPGCSLEGSAMEYGVSTRAIMRELGIELMEVDDWTCCGASAGDAQSYLLSLVLPARNIALAERKKTASDMMAPCSACYLNLRKVEDHVKRDEKLFGLVNKVLAEEGLMYEGNMRVRHLLDVLSTDIGALKIGQHVKRGLEGITIAPYYGCQCLRPYKGFDDPERPSSMEPLIEALGGSVHSWSMGGKCCGAGLMTTKKDLALDLVGSILTAAKGADCIVTVCPMCQMNLDSFQKKASRLYGKDLGISVLYLTQLIGLAFGLAEEDLRLEQNFAITAPLREKLFSLAKA